MVWEVYNTLCVSCDESVCLRYWQWPLFTHGLFVFCGVRCCSHYWTNKGHSWEQSLNKDLCMFQFTLSNWRNDFLISVIHSSQFKLWICMKHCSVDKYMLRTLLVRSWSFCDFEIFFFSNDDTDISEVAINAWRLRIGEP